jgi:hypothetical protein
MLGMCDCAKPRKCSQLRRGNLIPGFGSQGEVARELLWAEPRQEKPREMLNTFPSGDRSLCPDGAVASQLNLLKISQDY